MSRLFTAWASEQEIADQFDVSEGAAGPVPPEMVEGDVGPVVLEAGGTYL